MKVFLLGQSDAPYAALAREMKTSEGALKVSIHRLRKRYRELFRHEREKISKQLHIDNDRQRGDADTGAYKRHWGAYGNKPDDKNLGPYNPDAPLAQQFRLPHNVALSKDGLVYVADRVNDRIKVFKTDGTYLREGFVSRRTLLAGSASAQTSYPMLTHVVPVAVQRGKTAEVTVSGQMNLGGVYKATGPHPEVTVFLRALRHEIRWMIPGLKHKPNAKPEAFRLEPDHLRHAAVDLPRG